MNLWRSRVERETLYITGEARTNIDNAITKIYGLFYIALEVDRKTGDIYRFDCNATLELTKDFLKNIFEGKNILKDEEEICNEINRRYFASSSRAIIVAYRDALQKFKKINL